jgi:hypothetical protein
MSPRFTIWSTARLAASASTASSAARLPWISETDAILIHASVGVNRRDANPADLDRAGLESSAYVRAPGSR